ncbi:MAG TPA: GGDEF domain-containing protein [Wenzhouxiangella sp.]|nr:GGDEF domain-containing protein [Wenzhouxiangella sp.]
MLDIRTLLVMGVLIHLLMGGLTLMVAFGGRYRQTLMWCVAACVLGAVAYAAGLVMLAQGRSDPSLWLPSLFLVAAYACLWASLKQFSVRPSRLMLAAGPLAWAALGFWPAFMSSYEWARIAFSILAAAYMGLCMRELASGWANNRWLTVVVLFLLLVHTAYHLLRITILAGVSFSPAWQPDFSITVLVNVLFIISMTYAILAMASSRAERFHQHAARHDALTGLANRRVLFEWSEPRLVQAREAYKSLSVLMCDLDHFKQINDNYGHDAGNRVLVVFADVLRAAAGRDNLCARIGGEEFVVVAPGRGQTEAERLARRIQVGLEASTDQLPRKMTVSIGIAYTATVGYNLDRLLIRADQALYQAKNDGRNCFRTWSGDTAAHPIADNVDFRQP